MKLLTVSDLHERNIREVVPELDAWMAWMDQTFGVDGWNRTCTTYLKWKESDFLTNIEDTGLDDGLEPPATKQKGR